MRKEKHCIHCGKELIYKHRATKYCSQKCQLNYQYKSFIDKWKIGAVSGAAGEYSISSHVRRYLFEKYDSQCAQCGWHQINHTTGRIPLEVEHIDGHHDNMSEDNLTLLCPNCHSLTSTYRSLNMGNGRVGRKKYSDKHM